MTIDEIKADIASKLPKAMTIAQNDVYEIMDKKLGEFYAEYTPHGKYHYDRTYQLRNSAVKGEITSSSNSASAVVSFDPSTMSYHTGSNPSGEQVMGAANAGMHGALGLHMEVGSVMVYPESKEEVEYAHKTILKNALIEAGIPVK